MAVMQVLRRVGAPMGAAACTQSGLLLREATTSLLGRNPISEGRGVRITLEKAIRRRAEIV